MIHIYCNVPTKGMQKESESLGIPLDKIVLLHNIIMSLRNNPNYHPSTTELKNLYNSNSIELKMYRYAIPYYNVGRVVTPNESLIERDSNNNLILNIVNTNIPIEKYLTQLPKEAMQDITTRKELYTVLLWMENLKNTKNLSIEDSYKEAIKLLNEYKKLDPSYFEVSKPYKEVESFDNNNQLSSTKLVNGQIEITIKKVIIPEEFYDYIQGKTNSATSKQKKLVLDEMEKLGITFDKIKSVLNTSEKIKQFVYLHGLSHKLNYKEDMTNYNRSDINAPENVAIELRANLFAWEQMNGISNPFDSEGHYSIQDVMNLFNNNKAETKFSVSTSNSYPQRTKENADWSDITLALATDFNTKGEKLTKEVAKDKYVSYQLSELVNKAEDMADFLYNQIKTKGKTKDVKLNIAGNGIYSLNKEQSYYNDLMTEVLQKLLDKGVTISAIRSGGQTGIDEAGIIAAQRLGIPNEVHATSNYMFRNKDGKDIADEEQFKARFMGNSISQKKENKKDSKPSDSRKTYKGMIESLQPNQVFVFGSNTEGRHGLGAAKTAKDKFGAIYGQAEGPQGQSYAIITKDLTKDDKKHPSRTKEQIKEQIHKLYEYAKVNPNKEFLVAYSSTGRNLNYYTNQEMAEMFASEEIPSNIVFEEGFSELVKNNIDITPSRQETISPIMKEQQNNTPIEEDLPSIGVPTYNNELKVDRESPRAILAREMTPYQIFNRENLIAREFSKVIDQFLEDTIEETTELLNNTEDKLEQLNYSNKLNDLNSENGRRIIIEELGFETINDEIKLRFQDWVNMSNEDYMTVTGSSEKADYIREQYQKILDNYDVLFSEASIMIENNERLRLIKTELEEEDENGEKVHGNEGYTFKIRFVNSHDSARGETRRALSGIKQIDSNGNPVLDDLGNPVYLREDFVHSTLLGFLSKELVTPDDFVLYDRENDDYSFPALEKLQEQFPWVSQIINKLAYDPNLISIFYTDFRKEFISYWGQFEGNPTKLNIPVEIDSTINKVNSNYESGNRQDDNSVYNSDLSINKDNVEKGKVLADKIIKDLQRADNDDLVEISNEIMKLLNMLGFSSTNISKETFLNEDNKTKIRNVVENAKDILNKLPKSKEGSHYTDSFRNQIENIAFLVGKATELDATTTFREMGKDYPSYGAPNEIEITFKKLKDNRYRDKFLEEQFKKYDWFYYTKNKKTDEKEWSNEMLRLIEKDSNIRDNMILKNVFVIDQEKYSDWTRPIISSAFVREYFYTEEKADQTHNFGFFNFPIFSDTEMATFIKFKKYTGDFKSSLNPLFRKLVWQELRRMSLVEKRNKLGIPKISNFDVKGAKFCFLPELNTEKIIVDKVEGTLLDFVRMYSQEGYERPDKIEEAISIAVNQIMNKLFKEFLENNPSLLKDKSLIEFIKKQSIMSADQNVINKLEEYFWNQTFMTSQIIQIMTTDLAFYKNSVDFQKRFKEVYAAGTRLNTNSPYGRKVEKTIYVSDEIMTSPTYKPLKDLFYESYQEGKISKMDYDSILDKFKTINATDGQAYRSISSYRAIMDMLGLWNENLENTFNRLKEGEWNMGDINSVFQTIKPFVFGHVDTPNGLGETIKVPHQNKNSEFLLLATHQVLGTVLNKSEQLKALNDFMEDNNIDVVQFESAVKVGGSGIINVSVSSNKIQKAVKEKTITINNKKYNLPDIEIKDITKTYKSIKEYFDSLLDNNSISQEDYNDVIEYFKPNYKEVLNTLTTCAKSKINPTDVIDKEDDNLTFVHKLSYESYMIAQPTPEHVFDVESIFGSQFRNLIVSDLPENIEVEIEGIKIKGKDNVRKMYFSLIVENLLESYGKVAKDFSSIEKLQEKLLAIVRGNPKYGRDMLNALEIVEYNGRKVFNMPFNDRMIAAKFEELMTSVFKNNITKQYIKGASCIAVSNFGFTNELQVQRNEDGGIKAIECYLPATSKQLYEPFLKEIRKNGNILGYEIDYNKIKEEDESLLELIGFRIPTEGKYSMLPLRIKGFLPQQNGSSIMLPAEVTTLSGADFDVDKFFLFLPEFKWNTKYNLKKAWDDFYKDSNNKDIVEEIEKNIGIAMEDFIARNPDEDNITFEEYLDFTKSKGVKYYQLTKIVDKKKNITKAQKRFKEWFKERKDNYFVSRKLERVKYNINKEPKDNSREQRNNAIIQLSLGILRNKEVGTASQIPGNFDTLKDTSRVSEIYTNKKYLDVYMKKYKLGSIRDAVTHLLNNNLDTLDDFMKDNRTEDNPLTIDTFMKYHYQNMTGGALIGIYANNTTMQAKLQGRNLRLKDGFTFTIDGKLIKNLTDVYTEETVNGRTITKRISQNCAEFSAASVDNVKDPVLASLLQNKDTASIACFMLRAGLSIPQIGALFNLPLISNSIKGYGNLNPLSEICGALEKEVANIRKSSTYKAPVITDFNTIDMIEATILFNDKKYVEQLTDNQKVDLYEKVLGFAKGFQFIAVLSEYLNETVRAYRADSPNGAIEISLAKAKVQTLKLNNILVKSTKIDYPFEGVENILTNDYLSLEDTKDVMREKLMNSEMPMLQGFYSLGIDLGLKTIASYFTNASNTVNNIINFIQHNRVTPLKDSNISSIYEAINLFGLSNTKLFGNDENMSMEEKFIYYTRQFPRDFAKIVEDNPDIKELYFIQKLVASDTQGLVMRDSARNTSYLRELLTNSADSLLYLDNPQASKLAIGLLRYAYYKEKLNFGPHSFNQYFSTIFKNGFPEYIETLRELENSMNTDKRWDKLLDQIYANNPNLAISVDIEDFVETEDNKLIVSSIKNVKNPNTMVYQPLDYITNKEGILYKLNESLSDETKIVYDKLEKISKIFYNINKDLNESIHSINLYDKVYKEKIIEDNKRATITLPKRREDNTETGNIMEGNKADVLFAGVEQEWNLEALNSYLAIAESKAEELQQRERYSALKGLEEMEEKPCKNNIPKGAISLGSI